MGLNLLMGGGFDIEEELVGFGVGHLYYFVVDVIPHIPETYNLKLIAPPEFLVRLCQWLHIHDFGAFGEDGMNGLGGWFLMGEDEQ